MAIKCNGTNVTKVYSGYGNSSTQVKQVYAQSGTNKQLVYNAELSLDNLQAPRVFINDPGIGAWGGQRTSNYFTITDYSKITCVIKVTTTAYRTSSWSIVGTATLYLEGATSITLGSVSQAQNYGGNTSKTLNISYNIPSNLSGNYRLRLTSTGFRENTNAAATGYADCWATDILLQ